MLRCQHRTLLPILLVYLEILFLLVYLLRTVLFSEWQQ